MRHYRTIALTSVRSTVPSRPRPFLQGRLLCDLASTLFEVPASAVERTTRRARADDVAALVDLRRLMFQDMGSGGATDSDWQDAARQWFARRVAAPGVCLIVVEAHDVVVAAAMGTLRDAAPSPSSPRPGDVLIRTWSPRRRTDAAGTVAPLSKPSSSGRQPLMLAELSSWQLLKASRCTSTPGSVLPHTLFYGECSAADSARSHLDRCWRRSRRRVGSRARWN